MSGANEMCKKCRFYVSHPNPDSSVQPRRDGVGHCHRHAPRPLDGGSGTGWSDWEWPAVIESEFCGEWVRR